MKAKVLGSAIAMLVIAGCSSNKISQTKKTDAPKIPLYALLKNTSNGYQFAQFSNDYVRGKPWVRLSDGNPMWDTRKEDCTIGLTPVESERCSKMDDTLFMYKGSDFTAEKTAQYAVLSVISIGIMSIAPPGSVEFDKGKYNKALEEANTTFKDKYPNYRAYLERFDFVRTKMETKVKEIGSAYYNHQSKPVKLTIVDKSGLYKNNTVNTKTFERGVKLSKANFTRWEHFSDDNLYKLVDSINSYEKLRLDQIRLAAENYLLSCNPKYLRNIHFKYQCAPSVGINNKSVSAKVIISSVDYNDVIPSSLKASDKHLRVWLEGRKVYVENKTSKYIVVSSIAFYYQSKIASLSNLDINLPPHGLVQEKTLSDFPVDWALVSFKNMTKYKVKRTKVHYGWAIKYSSEGGSNKTLYKDRDIKLENLI
ncbi:hypothetical protein L4C34_04660 [Vibrio profundum]|uniref:hypothetical protein n=1 Tax=Vibrio profundum TaxID=2910247 RepID=UPI003D0CFC82